MPEIVANYAELKDLSSLSPLYESIIASYLDDVEKYPRNRRLGKIIKETIKEIFRHGGERVTLENFGQLGYKWRDMKEVFDDLENSLLFTRIYPLISLQRPLSPKRKKSPRLQVLDTGLLNHYSGWFGDLIGIRDLSGLYRGRILQHVIGQELIQKAFGRIHQPINFWVRDARGSSAEVDFVIEEQGYLISFRAQSWALGTVEVFA